MSTIIDTQKLSNMIRAKRGDRGLRDVSRETGLSAPTLSRIEQGKLPDVETFMKLCEWLEVSADAFTIGNGGSNSSGKMALITHLRAEKELEPETVNMLIKMIDLAYQKTEK